MKDVRRWYLGAGLMLAFAVLAGGFSLSESAAEHPAVKARRKLMRQNTKLFKQIIRKVKKRDLDGLAELVRRFEAGVKKIPSVYKEKVLSEKSRAKASIWDNKAKFENLARKMAEAAENLSAAARSKDLSKLTMLAMGLGKRCGACHKPFRKPKKKKKR